MPPLVLLSRHGSTNFSSPMRGPELIRGQNDVPLNDEGLREAQQVGEALCQLPIGQILSSDLKRALWSAQAIQRACQQAQGRVIPLSATPLLRPWNLGDYQGQPADKYKAVIDKMMTVLPFTPAPHGESYAQFAQRFLGFLVQILRSVERTPTASIPLLMTHSRNQRLAGAWLKAGAGTTLDTETLLNKPTTETGETMVLTLQGGRWAETAPPPAMQRANRFAMSDT